MAKRAPRRLAGTRSLESELWPRLGLPGTAHLVAVTIRGDGMADTLRPGDQVVVDLTQQTPSPPGLFLVWDGLATAAKRLEYVTHRSPPAVRVISDNPRYATYELAAGRLKIVGRIIGCWREVP